MFPERSWEVLLIGGSSGSGKTTISYELARFYQINVVKVDAINQAIKAMTTAENLPMLHYFEGGVDWLDLGVAGNVEWLMNVSHEITPAIKAVIEKIHLADSEPCIMEGDFIHPKLCSSFSDTRVKSCFIHESEQDQILQNFLNREGTHQSYRAEISCTHGNLLAKLCSEYKVSVVEARPWNNIIERVIDVLKNPAL